MGVRPDIERLQAKLDSYRLLVDEVKDYAIFLLDLQGNVVSWNMGAERIKQYRPEEIIGKHFSIFYTEEDRKQGRPERNLKQALAHGRIEDEGWLFRIDGSRFFSNVVITRLEDEQGEILGFSKITRDLTERKKAEDKIRKLNEDLERRVEERTAELKAANEILKQRRAEAEEASRLKSEFVSNVSHELRTPLNAIIGYTSLLLYRTFGEISPRQEQALRSLQRNAQSLLSLINDLLDLSRIESGKMPILLERVEVKSLLLEAFEEVKMMIQEKPIEVIWKVGKQIQPIQSDPRKIR